MVKHKMKDLFCKKKKKRKNIHNLHQCLDPPRFSSTLGDLEVTPLEERKHYTKTWRSLQ